LGLTLRSYRSSATAKPAIEPNALAERFST
jgi:hypothetical protein